MRIIYQENTLDGISGRNWQTETIGIVYLVADETEQTDLMAPTLR